MIWQGVGLIPTLPTKDSKRVKLFSSSSFLLGECGLPFRTHFPKAKESRDCDFPKKVLKNGKKHLTNQSKCAII